MLEERVRPLDVDESQVERLVERLRQQQDAQDKWFGRGRSDGQTWTRETATLEDLKEFDEQWSDVLDGMTVSDFDAGELEGLIDDMLP
jgi:hypothetical protein